MVVVEARSSQLLTVSDVFYISKPPISTGFAASVDIQHRNEYLGVHFGDREMRRAAPTAKEIARFDIGGTKS